MTALTPQQQELRDAVQHLQAVIARVVPSTTAHFAVEGTRRYLAQLDRGIPKLVTDDVKNPVRHVHPAIQRRADRLLKLGEVYGVHVAQGVSATGVDQVIACTEYGERLIINITCPRDRAAVEATSFRATRGPSTPLKVSEIVTWFQLRRTTPAAGRS